MCQKVLVHENYICEILSVTVFLESLYLLAIRYSIGMALKSGCSRIIGYMYFPIKLNLSNIYIQAKNTQSYNYTLR